MVSSRGIWCAGLGLTSLLLLLYLHLATELSNLHTVLRLAGAPVHTSFLHGSLGLGGSGQVGSKTLDLEELVIIYNRVPKTGSTSLIGLAYDLCSINGFNVIHINTSRNSPTLSLSDQMKFVYNVSNWSEKKPGVYHGHLAYIDFARFGVSRVPVYINVVRAPLDRLVSYFYFLRYGDDLRPNLVRKRQGDKMTLDECVLKQHVDCSASRLWIQVPFFCGQHAECWVPGSEWALQQAKHNLVAHYLLVGITEEMESFVALLEGALPRVFHGALQLYQRGNKSHLRRTVRKVMPSEDTIARLQNTKVWRLENDFYHFAAEQFHFTARKGLTLDAGRLALKRNNFNYEKIKPKPN
ncbi:heparan sulfate 2-O-sulfotransferase 1 [Hyalella azteca]|uniref:Heparan sulfate 2-O-sulfotransferase 1 n=1 Tax=Hyalella azteca TaxID=294128 RepID=A0A8B7P5U1_HYAAZ|nr:heparan sulfate 2-O-sulfotransferase 1 [Hyalella azteca]